MSKFLKQLGRKELLTPHVDRWFERMQPQVSDIALPIQLIKPEDSYFHPSSHAIGCARTIFSGFDPIVADEVGKRVWNNKVGVNGHLWHALLEHIIVNELGFAQTMELPITVYRTAAGVRVIDGDPVPAAPWIAKGTLDLPFVKIPGIEGEDFVVDIKTMNPESFIAATPPEYLWLKYQAQMQLYLDWTNTERGILFCVKAANPFDFKEIIIERDRDVAQMIYSKWDAVAEALSTETIPDHTCADPTSCSSNAFYENTGDRPRS